MRIWLFFLFFLCFAGFPFLAQAQAKPKKSAQAAPGRFPKAENAVGSISENASLTMESVEIHRGSAAPPPKWSLAQGYLNDRPVYFPDYYLFYTPERGYIYWQDGQWVSGRNIPSFAKDAELKRARVHIIEDTEVNAHPEKQFTRYRDDFPAEQMENPVPAPDID